MIFRSIVGKLWLIIIIFAIMILGTMYIVQSFVFKDIYYGQQSEQLIAEGKRLAEFIKVNPDPEVISARVKTASEVLNANIVVVEGNNVIAHGYGGMGMGMGMLRHLLATMEQEDMLQLEKGNIVVHRGYHPMFQRELLWAAIPVPKKTTAPAVVFVLAPLQQISEQVQVFRSATLYVLAGVILLAVFLSFFLSRSLSRPLLQMNHVARSMSQGNYSRKVPVKSKDEIGLLAQSLNNLSEELQEKIAAINRMDQTRRDFVANVSHELRTPLTIMQGYTEAMLDGFAETEEEQQKYLNTILEELLRLKRLVNDVLDLRRLEAGQVVLNKQKVDIKELIEKVVAIFEPFAKEKEIRFLVDAEELKTPVYGDRDRLEQVFVNLIDNAMRHNPVGGEIKIRVIDAAGKVKILISDTGAGIPAEQLPLIWERFYKLDRARSRAGEGSGLGLAITKGIIQAHGGDIRATSEVGRGTMMEFTLPIHREKI